LIQLAARPDSASAGRRFIKTILQVRGVSEFEDAVLLCTSELVTNAINAELADEPPGKAQVPPGAAVVLCMEITEPQLRIEVWDTSPELPALRNAGEDEEHGRGLAPVDAICDRWGCDLLFGSHARGPCKVTWCEWDRAVSPTRPDIAAFREWHTKVLEG
jgi:anti-sigma regulatory factor (Ser/Thr protein kinase)